MISLTLLLSPAISFAAGDHSDGGHGAMDMPGHNMDMSSHGMDISGPNIDMQGHDMNMPGDVSTTGGGHDGMGHGGSAPPGAAGGDIGHGDNSHGGHNSQQVQGSPKVDSRAVLGGFGLVNGLVILSAAILKRKSAMTGGN